MIRINGLSHVTAHPLLLLTLFYTRTQSPRSVMLSYKHMYAHTLVHRRWLSRQPDNVFSPIRDTGFLFVSLTSTAFPQFLAHSMHLVFSICVYFPKSKRNLQHFQSYYHSTPLKSPPLLCQSNMFFMSLNQRKQVQQGFLEEIFGRHRDLFFNMSGTKTFLQLRSEESIGPQQP